MGAETEIEDVISFWYKGSVNENDDFYFQIHSTKYPLTGTEWQYFELPLETGSHLFKWIFARKSNADEGSGSIDLIKLPPMHYDFTDVEEFAENDNNIIMYPNPGNDELHIIMQNTCSSKLQVFDIQGRLVLEKDIEGDITTINTDNWAAGMYFWKVGNEAGKWIKSK